MAPTSVTALPDPAQPDLSNPMAGSLVYSDSGEGTARLDLSRYVHTGKTVGIRIVCGGGGPRFSITASTSRLLASGGCDVTPYGYSRVADADERILTLHTAANQHWRLAVWAG